MRKVDEAAKNMVLMRYARSMYEALKVEGCELQSCPTHGKLNSLLARIEDDLERLATQRRRAAAQKNKVRRLRPLVALALLLSGSGCAGLSQNIVRPEGKSVEDFCAEEALLRPSIHTTGYWYLDCVKREYRRMGDLDDAAHPEG